MLAREKKVPLRHLPHFFATARREKFSGFNLLTVPSGNTFSRFSCIISSGKSKVGSVERSSAKRAVYERVTAILAQKLVYNLDIVCVLYSRPTETLLKQLEHAVSLLTLSPPQNSKT